MTTTNRVLEAAADDVADVVEALDIARVLLQKDDRATAARFVRRASEAAHTPARRDALARAADALEAPSIPAPKTSETRLSRPAVAPVTSKPPPLPSRPPKVTTAPPPPSAVSKTRSLKAVSAEAEARRVRVSVRVSARDGTLLVVRPLADGESPPAGTREAYLVMVETVALAEAASGGAR
jgi:hypothetical protein